MTVLGDFGKKLSLPSLSRLSLRVVTWSGVCALSLALGCSAGSPDSGIEGEVKKFVVDYEDGSHRVGYSLVTASGDEFELEFSVDPELLPGERIQVNGTFVDTTSRGNSRDDISVGSTLLSVVSFESIETATDLRQVEQEIVDGTPRTANMAVVLLNFDGVSPQSLTPNQARQQLDETRRYYQELSYGILDVKTDVFGPISVPKPSNCNISNIESIGRQAARNQGINIDSYDHVGFTLPSNGASGLDCACGLAWVGRTPAMPNPSIADGSIYTCTGANVFAHEFGHGLGLGHASTVQCGGQAIARNPYDSCSVDEYGNRFNTMGGGLGHMNAYQKASMKWMAECNLVRATKSAIYEILPIQAEVNGIQGLQIPTGDTKDGNALYYYVEFRNPNIAEFNSGPSSSTTESQLGVHVDVAPDFALASRERRPLLLDLGTPMNGHRDPRLTTGRSFTDPSGRVTVTVLDMNQERARIEVSFPGGGSGQNLCVNGQAPDGSVEPPTTDQVTLYQHCAYGGYQVNLGAGRYTAAQLAALGVTNNDVSSLKLGPGYTATLYDGDNFSGTSVTLSGNDTCLVSSSFNDRLSSLVIERRPVARLYQHCSYGGYEVSLAPGDYTAAALTALGAFDNDLSSVQVDPGFEVILYSGDNFSGSSVTRSANTTCLVTQNFNDQATSVRVRAL